MDQAKLFCKFIDNSPTPYHVVKNCKEEFEKCGFEYLNQSNEWNLKKNKSYYTTINDSAVIAFSIGGKYEPGNGFIMAGAHTDSPCLMSGKYYLFQNAMLKITLKPSPDRFEHTYQMAAVQTYGGGNWLSWFNRDLILAGRVMHKKNGKIVASLLKTGIVGTVPQIAPHLYPDLNNGFKLNKENHLNVILGLNKDNCTITSIIEKHLKIEEKDILDYELYFSDAQLSSIGGADDDFIFGPRQDNLIGTFTLLHALTKAKNLSTDNVIRFFAAYDNEEVGSKSVQGANTSITRNIINRIVTNFKDKFGLLERTLHNSFLLSVDCGHALHPAHTSYHVYATSPKLNKGPVLKYNASQAYTTSSIGAAIIKTIAKSNNIMLQEFVNRSDVGGGSTIGPYLSTNLGVRSVDLGGTQLSMHSIREMCAVNCISSCTDLWKAVYESFSTIEIEHLNK
ncbi:hypothetical protein A3Q56_03464 [Intoshia linei]|uniref:Aspartyl aminopeptidase n=1 Tax=Intoshia linei TaxID=1819745 RepID=A0A177B3P0_9BILA|nr:hypothetical protein A3Q56_03464 [Intoshia linei]